MRKVVVRPRASANLVLPHFLLREPLQRKHARAEEFWPSPAIHHSFECFQAVDLPFCLAIAPRLGNGIPHRVDVSLQRASETLHRVEARLLSVFQTDAELANALAFEHAPKSHGESTHCGEFWPALFHRIDFCSLIGGQQSSGLMQSAAATIGEIERPVAGSRGCGLGTIGAVVAALRFGLRHFANSRSRFEKLPV